ncbi:MAG: MarR family winged helix-turn-helix transcriptional regulator [Sphaerochaeta sp.]|uniref:MarR family winged helix-turn-helix transcriptional regulator n=1 Tax=Sphaerochaeta sp. TaxID=1972642 RepID=UPI002FC9DBFB
MEDSTLKEQLIHALLRFKKLGMTFPADYHVNVGEFFVMKNLEKGHLCPEGPMNVSDIHHNLHVTKPAISQMLNSLEKKGYVSRAIDPTDRRRISVTLTEEGSKVLKAVKQYMDQTLEMTITRFGEDNVRELISLFTLLVDISEDVQAQAMSAYRKGENLID